MIVSQHSTKNYIKYLIYNKQILVELSNDKTKIKLPNNLIDEIVSSPKQLHEFHAINNLKNEYASRK